jgi:hypothetical protein
VTKINLFDLGGVAMGDYVIIDYNNASPIADALSHFTITNPNGFAAGSASLINDTANQDIVLHSPMPGLWTQPMERRCKWKLGCC